MGMVTAVTPRRLRASRVGQNSGHGLRFEQIRSSVAVGGQDSAALLGTFGLVRIGGQPGLEVIKNFAQGAVGDAVFIGHGIGD